MEEKTRRKEDQKHVKGLKAQTIVVREFELADIPEIQRIFYEGLMEMVADTAFRGLRHHPESLLLYTAMTVVCFVTTICWWVIGLLPAFVLCGRYFYSRHVIHGYLEHAMNTDMGDIEGFYMKSPDEQYLACLCGRSDHGKKHRRSAEIDFVITLGRNSADLQCSVLQAKHRSSEHVAHIALTQTWIQIDSCLWVAELEGTVVGVVAAVGQQISGGAVELQRMSVDRSFRRCGVGVALGRKVLEFAVTRRYSSVVLGTTSYVPAAHKLYQRLGFRCVGVTNGYVTPGARRSLLEQVFYRVRHHHYSLNVQNSRIQMDNTDSVGVQKTKLK